MKTVSTSPVSYRVNNQVIRLMVSFLVAALVVGMSFSAAKAEGLLTISPKQANALVQNQKDNPDFVILDIRTPAEFKSGHLKDAVLIDFYSKDFSKKMNALDKNKTYLIYCRSANRSTKALDRIKDMGFAAVYNMGQGVIGWTQAGFAIVK